MPHDPSVAGFYDRLAPDYHLIFPDWDASMARQGQALDRLIREHRADSHSAATHAVGTHSSDAPDALDVLDCSCGIGTQAIPLARRGHRVTATDISASAVTRAAREASARQARLSTAVADMRSLPFADACFDVVVSADNSLPHLLTPEDVGTALTEMRRVLRPNGLLIVSTRPYDEIRRDRPTSTPPQLGPPGPQARTVTFQLWHWHDDGERYDLEHFQLVPKPVPKLVPKGDEVEGAAEGEDWDVRVRRTTYWALTRRQLADLATAAGFAAPTWRTPEDSGFFQPVLTAVAGSGHPDRP